MLRLLDIDDGMRYGKICVQNETTGENYTVSCELTERQRNIILAGGLLNYTKEGGL